MPGITLLAIDCTTVERQTQGNPLRMTGDVHPILLGNEPPVFILEGVVGDRIASQAGFVPTEGVLEVIARRTNAPGAEAAHTARLSEAFMQGLTTAGAWSNCWKLSPQSTCTVRRGETLRQQVERRQCRRCAPIPAAAKCRRTRSADAPFRAVRGRI